MQRTPPYAHSWHFQHPPLKSGSAGQESIMQSLTLGLLFAKANRVPVEHRAIPYQAFRTYNHCWFGTLRIIQKLDNKLHSFHILPTFLMLHAFQRSPPDIYLLVLHENTAVIYNQKHFWAEQGQHKTWYVPSKHISHLQKNTALLFNSSQSHQQINSLRNLSCKQHFWA